MQRSGITSSTHHAEMRDGALFFDTKMWPAVGKLWTLIGKDSRELLSFLVLLLLESLLHSEVQF